MKCNVNYKNLANKIGVQKIYEIPKFFTPTYVVGVVNNRNITVSDMLKQIEYTVKLIKANFDVNQRKYQEALIFLKLCELRFMNQSSSTPNKKRLILLLKFFTRYAIFMKKR